MTFKGKIQMQCGLVSNHSLLSPSRTSTAAFGLKLSLWTAVGWAFVICGWGVDLQFAGATPGAAAGTAAPAAATAPTTTQYEPRLPACQKGLDTNKGHSCCIDEKLVSGFENKVCASQSQTNQFIHLLQLPHFGCYSPTSDGTPDWHGHILYCQTDDEAKDQTEVAKKTQGPQTLKALENDEVHTVAHQTTTVHLTAKGLQLLIF
jgi:hypothetical protein